MAKRVFPATALFDPTLTPEQTEEYADVIRVVQDIVLNNPRGLIYLLNALAFTGDETLPRVMAWTKIAIRSGGSNPKAFAAFMRSCPLVVPKLVPPPPEA